MSRVLCKLATATVVLLGMGCAGSSTGVMTREQPNVLNVVPANGATDIDVRGPITITFTRAMMPGMEMLVILHEGSVSGAVVNHAACASLGGRTVTGGMMTGVMGSGMMGSGWQPANGSYGMIFTFTTA